MYVCMYVPPVFFFALADIRCPMKTFRIPVSRATLSEDAFNAALEVDSIHEAQEFLDNFGSHVSDGRQEVSVQRKRSNVGHQTLFFLREWTASDVACMLCPQATKESVRCYIPAHSCSCPCALSYGWPLSETQAWRDLLQHYHRHLGH